VLISGDNNDLGVDKTVILLGWIHIWICAGWHGE